MTTTLSTRARLLVLAVLVAVTAAVSSQRVAAAPFDREDLQRVETRVQSVAEKSLPAIVALTHGNKEGVASGSGTIFTKEGLIVTAAHVVRGTETVDVTFADGSHRKAKVLGADSSRDLALARIIAPGAYPFVELGHSKDLKVGDLVIAMGHAGGFDERRPAPVRFGRLYEVRHKGYLRSDCTLVGGDSGGPLFDLDGKLIGVHSSVGAAISVNNDVPIDVAHDNFQRLLAGERWGRPVDELPPPNIPAEQLAGLDVQAFRHRVMTAAIANNGQLAADPKVIAKWLTDCGMKADRVKAMSPEEIVKFVGKVIGDGAKVEGKVAGPASTRPTSQPALADKNAGGAATRPAGLDTEKLKSLVVAAGAESGGQLQVTPDRIAGWMREAGMSAESVRALSQKELIETFSKAMGGTAKVGATTRPVRQQLTAGQKTIVEMDRAVLATVRDDLSAVSKSIATLQNNGRTVALGTIVHANGLIVTKRSEVLPAGDKLTAKLADGRSLPAKVVKEFANDDLAVLKVDAEGLTPVKFDDAESAVRPGSFLFAPAPKGQDLMLATGVSSVAPRSLRDTGGFIGIGLTEVDGAVIAGEVVPTGPAGKAGIKKGDILLSIDGTPIKEAADLSRKVRKLAPGTIVHLTYRRPEKKSDAKAEPAPEKTADITIGDREKMPASAKPATNPALELSTRVSKVRTGFPSILQHDLPIKPEDCGGPIIDLNGKVVGVNIARAGRINSYAIPAATIAKLLQAGELEKLTR